MDFLGCESSLVLLCSTKGTFKELSFSGGIVQDVGTEFYGSVRSVLENVGENFPSFYYFMSLKSQETHTRIAHSYHKELMTKTRTVTSSGLTVRMIRMRVWIIFGKKCF